ncbi:MAG: hypothetical protein DME23_05985 [Verrucomicrobia bacterium]|nr:MAG: hypothetical protein DME23_05985 [Verrucomicrobiota bacterium]
MLIPTPILSPVNVLFISNLDKPFYCFEHGKSCARFERMELKFLSKAANFAFDIRSIGFLILGRYLEKNRSLA